MTRQPITVLVTQPHNHAQKLLSKLSSDGFKTQHFAAVSIQFIDAPAPATTPQFIVATSPNAITGAVQAGIDLPLDCPVFATGHGTAKQLAKLGINASVASPPGSEGLLALPTLNSLSNAHGWLLTGKGGRGLLEQELPKLGLSFDRVETYARVGNQDRPSLTSAANANCQLATASSGEALDNIALLADAETQAKLAACQWIVSSPRIANTLLKHWPQTKYKLAAGPSAEALFEACQTWRHEHQHD